MKPKTESTIDVTDRRTDSRTADAVAAGWLIRKRDGREVPFDCGKVRSALVRCFTRVAGGVDPAVVEKVTKGVVNTVVASRKTPDVEDVQRYVIQQLWARGLFDAAEHYQNYREAHRKARTARPVTPAVAERARADQKHFKTDAQYYQFMSKFSRWRDADARRETWRETVYERVCPWLFARPGADLTGAERAALADAMFALEASPAMRVVQMAGPALDRCNVGAYNCAYHPLSDIFAFPELLYILMQGTGAGFSVEDEYVSDLPRVRKQTGRVERLVCSDSTEGWCDTFHRHLQLLWDGCDTEIDVSAVRPKNARLKTKGGRASGPGPFLELIAFSRRLLKSRQGRFLEDIDAHDLACMIGKIVQVGGVRRAAEISLSELRSLAMRDAKSGNWYETAVHRTMANNSAVYEDRPSIEVFTEEWLALMKSKSGERGIFNRVAVNKCKPARRKEWRFGCNPCGEIVLRPFEFCNLSMAIARPDDTPESLERKVRLAAYFGKLQSLATDFKYIRPDWKRNCDEERLLGVDITGHADCPLLRFDNPDKNQLIRRLQGVVWQVDIDLSRRFGVNQSAANTCLKPGGDSAIFFDCASGLSPRFARHGIRWFREPKETPVARFLKDSGVPFADAPEAPAELYVFGFPVEAPAGCVLRDDMTARDQFFNWLDWKRNWAEHSCSATIYVEEHEWLSLGAVVYEHFDEITGLAFLPKDNGRYTYAPNEELTADKFAEFRSRFPDLSWAKLPEYETDDTTTTRSTFACVGDRC